jgi:hypothetical protein
MVLVWENFDQQDAVDVADLVPPHLPGEWDVFVPYVSAAKCETEEWGSGPGFQRILTMNALLIAVWNGRRGVERCLERFDGTWESLTRKCVVVTPKLPGACTVVPSWNHPIRGSLLVQPEAAVSPDPAARPCVWCLCWDGRLRGCGMPAHALLIAACFHLSLPEYRVVIVVPGSAVPSADRAFGVPVINELGATRDPAYSNPLAVFELCWTPSPDTLRRMAEVHATRCAWTAGGSLPDALIKFAIPFFLADEYKTKPNVTTLSVLPGRKTEYSRHLFLYSPHYEYQASFLRCYYRCPTDVAPYMWSSLFLRTNLERAPEEIPDSEPRSREDYRLLWREERAKYHSMASRLFERRGTSAFCAEPNTTFNKTSLIPMLIADQASSDLSEMVVVSDSRIWHHAQPRVMRSELQANYHFMGRTPIGQLGARSTVLISWHNQCALNFLTLDSLFLGLKVVHNSEPWRSVGYYYAEHDVETAAGQVRRALGDGPDTYELPDATLDLLWRYSIFHPDNQAECRRLVERAVELRPREWRPLNQTTEGDPTCREAPAPASVCGQTSGVPTPGSSFTP